MQKLAIAAAAVAALAVPSLAHAGDVAMRVQEIPLGGRSLAAVPAAMHFNMLASHWTGGGGVSYRVHRLHGCWSAWTAADADVAPDGGTGRWHDGNLDWTGAADMVQFRTRGDVRRLRSYELWSRVTTASARHLAEAGSPSIVPRSGWGADEEIVRAKPTYAPAVRLLVVHHTAGSNAYSPAQAAAIVRGIEVYHVEGNGWNDIGYNFLVDRFGTVYEGRGGGIDRNVVGAHSAGFNSGTAGVALIGNFSVATPPKAQQDALVALAAWRLDVAHVDPLSTVVYTSGGNAKFKSGTIVTLRAVSGHRDTGPSECPGSAAYRLLPGLAKRIGAAGLPKLYSPTVSGALGGPIRFQARVSSALPWTVAVVDQFGHTAATGAGTGPIVDWTWGSLVAGKGLYRWTISSPGSLAATGTIGVSRPVPPPTVSLTNLAATPSVITPNSDGSDDSATVSFTLGGPAQVIARVLDEGGAPLLTLINEHRLAGNNSFEWGAHVLPDGRYRMVVTATAPAGPRSVTKSVVMVVDRTLAALDALPRVISPNADGVADTTTFSFMLAQNVPVRLDIEQLGAVVATPFQGQLGIGPHTLVWDGTSDGAALPDGDYIAVVTVTDQLGDIQLSLPLTIDTTPPVLSILDARALMFTLDEPATVTILVNQKKRIVQGEGKGVFTIGVQGAVYQLSAEAQDLAGNISAVVTGP
ncbi:MAG: N-acetylmuramoyl-L-alanine amidase [Actinomycetota bacterium]|nr:N-acetylmuramoyl-L-alanine amidase [Actinomycetota bacterium]